MSKEVARIFDLSFFIPIILYNFVKYWIFKNNTNLIERKSPFQIVKKSK